MYGNYYHRRIQDNPLPIKKNRVTPETPLSSQVSAEFKQKPSTLKHRGTKGRLRKTSMHRRTFKEVATIIVNAIRFEKAANFQKDGWRHEVHGGVKMWVNEITGEVSTERPWKADIATLKEVIKIAPTPKIEQKKKRMSISRRLSIMFFGAKDKDNSSSSATTLALSRQSSLLNDNQDNDEKGSSEVEELFRMIDEEKKKSSFPF
jgi:hypothetical protein